MTCPCGSTQPLDLCCGPIIAGAPAPTAEALMRSRYTAFVRAEIDHIMNTHDPDTRGDVDRAGVERWSRTSRWQGLTIVHVEAGGPDDDQGVVEFVARHHTDGADRTHHERSRFRRREGRWFYVDGRPATTAPIRAAPKPERNGPCPCGSGKKYKRCHG